MTVILKSLNHDVYVRTTDYSYDSYSYYHVYGNYNIYIIHQYC